MATGPDNTMHAGAATPAAPPAGSLVGAGVLAGVAGLGGAAGVAFLAPQGAGRFWFAYLVAFAFLWTVSLGALFFVLLQHVTRAGWSVVVRRSAEVLAAAFPLLALMFLVLLAGADHLYAWMHPAGDPLLEGKAAYLNLPFFVARFAFYFAVWGGLGWFYWRQSVRQDATGDVRCTRRLERWSGLGLVLFALSVNFGAFDLLMSLDPHWYSTIFGVYVFAGAVVAAVSVLILVHLARPATATAGAGVEHYHDLGKLLFAFVFFWGYIAFSQYMLIWYANLPEETGWLVRRGLSTARGAANAYSVLAVLLLAGHFLLPFAALLPRLAKRRRAYLGFWAVWMLLMHLVDLFWLIRPELRVAEAGDVPPPAPTLVDAALVALCLLGLGGFYLAYAAQRARRSGLLPRRDPRLDESLAFHQAF